MSVNYSSGLSQYENKGVCGLPEIVDPPEIVKSNVQLLKQLIVSSKSVVVHCGAGISTSCGIPDFRGPKGVWTLEKLKVKEESPSSISFKEAIPSITHRALLLLTEKKYIHFIISQNVDGLFLRTGFSRSSISELHGNFFLDECNHCFTRFIRSLPSPTMGLKLAGPCPRPGRPCRGTLRDTILDWDDDLPTTELSRAIKFSEEADLSICLGTSLQIIPAANLPFLCKKRKKDPGKIVIVNLQQTKYDTKVDLVIHEYVDNVMLQLTKLLSLEIPPYYFENDPTYKVENKVMVWK